MGINAEYMGDTANFPGPKYGLPGYKESHKWETDVDVFSPLVFDPRFYRALIHMKSASAGVMSESALRVHWDTAVKAKKAPNCPQGNVFFDANEYYKMHKRKPEFNMGGNACSLIVRVYVGQGVFKGYETSQYQAGSKAFPTLATKLFAPVGSKRKSASSAVFQVKAGQYFGTPMPGAGVFDNSFTAARHMTLVFWLQVAPQSEAPNAELFAYGGAQTDNYFRTGFGCIAASVASKKTKCYFITVFQAGTTKEYFHTYNNDNFEIPRCLWWLQVGSHRLHAHHCCPWLPWRWRGRLPYQRCLPSDWCCVGRLQRALFLWINRHSVKLVDWNDGTSTKYAPKWKGPVTGSTLNLDPIWKNPKPRGPDGIHRRFWVTPVVNVKSSGITNNELKWDFPWTTSYQGGLYFCDLAMVPSGAGGFGDATRRVYAVGAFFQSMMETRKYSCAVQGVPNIGPAGGKPPVQKPK